MNTALKRNPVQCKKGHIHVRIDFIHRHNSSPCRCCFLCDTLAPPPPPPPSPPTPQCSLTLHYPPPSPPPKKKKIEEERKKSNTKKLGNRPVSRHVRGFIFGPIPRDQNSLPVPPSTTTQTDACNPDRLSLSPSLYDLLAPSPSATSALRGQSRRIKTYLVTVPLQNPCRISHFLPARLWRSSRVSSGATRPAG